MRLGIDGAGCLVTGLCTIFALVVTAAEAWQGMPRSNGRRLRRTLIDAALDQTSSGRREKFYIHCRLSYPVGAERDVANVSSSNVPSPKEFGNITAPTRLGRLKRG